MIPAQHNITIRRGDTFRLFFRLREKQPDGSPGDYPDLTGWGDGLAQVREGIDGTVIFTMTVTKANQVSYPGGILLSIADDTTKDDFPDPMPSSPVWDFEIVNSLGETDTYLAGDVTLVKDVSYTP